MRDYYTILIIFISFSVSAQKLLEIPPGTIKVNDTLFIDKAPVDNLMYAEFIDNVEELWTYTLSDSLKSLELENIDKSLLTSSLDKTQNKAIFNRVTIAQDIQLPKKVDIYSYFNYPQYKHNPVIGISKDLAQLFCQWRSDMVNLRWSTELKEGDPQYYKIKYRLPTPNEYRLAKKYFSDKDSFLVINEKSPLKIDLEELHKEDKFILSKNPEFTSTKQHFKDEPIKSEKTFHTEERFIFFRCICEVQK